MTNPAHQSSVEEDVLKPIRARGDRILCAVCCFLWLVSLAFAPMANTWLPWAVIATSLCVVATLVARYAPGSRLSRNTIAVLLMAFSALLIHQSGGLIETHFIIFALLSFLLYYRDATPIGLAAGTAAVHHYVFCRLQMSGFPVYIFPAGHPCTMVYVHAAYVVFETAVLVFLARMIRTEALEAATIAALGRRVAAGGSIDLTLASAEALGASSRGLLEFLQAIDHAVARASFVTHGVSSVSTQMNLAATRMVRSGREQRSTSASVVQAVERMTDATSDITSNCNEVARLARASGTVIEQGRESMQVSVQMIQSLAASVNCVSAEIEKLHDSSLRIEGIIKLIADLADQTSLLAINASIEAARAGELGRGFSVVAQEVRDLSERTHSSLAQAQGVVKQVKAQTVALVGSVDQCRDLAVRGGAQLSQTNGTLEGVLRELPHVVDRADTVLSRVRQHSSLSREVVEHMREIAETSSGNSTDLDQIDILSASLRTMSTDLCQAIDIFKPQPAT